jgi:sulfite exporter TauE/SafE
MLSYTTAGFLAGQFGRTVLGTESPVWVSSLALITISALLLMNGYRAITGRALHFALPHFASNISSNLWKQISSPRFPRIAGAGLAGGLTVFLPCGHLYGFLIGAVATGNGLRGAVFMFAFWLGSTPLLSFGARWFHRLMSANAINGQRLAGVLLVIAGLFSLGSFALRMNSSATSAHSHEHVAAEVQAPRCH